MVTITGLLAGVNYTFTVIAFTEIGVSAPSEPLTLCALWKKVRSHLGLSHSTVKTYWLYISIKYIL